MCYNNVRCGKTAHRGIAQLVEYRSPKPWVAGSNPPAPAKSLGRFRSDREKTRKAEISRDFSAFFDSKVFQNFVDAFRAFRVCRQIRTATM